LQSVPVEVDRSDVFQILCNFRAASHISINLQGLPVAVQGTIVARLFGEDRSDSVQRFGRRAPFPECSPNRERLAELIQCCFVVALPSVHVADILQHGGNATPVPKVTKNREGVFVLTQGRVETSLFFVDLSGCREGLRYAVPVVEGSFN
jgi:hypothetical protein